LGEAVRKIEGKGLPVQMQRTESRPEAPVAEDIEVAQVKKWVVLTPSH
jgi:hypothetical protein